MAGIFGRRTSSRRRVGQMTSLPLEGIRIADFGQIIAVPYTAQMRAWLGAEVILIEN